MRFLRPSKVLTSALTSAVAFIGTVFIAMFVSSNSQAQDKVVVFDVRKTLQMYPEEPVFRDYYINAGSEEGLRENMIVTVVRRMSMHDGFQNKSPGDLIVPVGKLIIIHAQRGVSVARFHSMEDREGLPMLDYHAIMIGDRLDLGKTEMGSGKGKGRGKGGAGIDPALIAPPEPTPAPQPAAAASLAPTITPPAEPFPPPPSVEERKPAPVAQTPPPAERVAGISAPTPPVQPPPPAAEKVMPSPQAEQPAPPPMDVEVPLIQ